MKKLLLFVLLPLLAVNYSCDSLPDASLTKAKRYTKKIEGTRKAVKRNDSLYKEHLSGFSYLEKYDEKENLKSKFQEALKNVDAAEKHNKTFVLPLIDKNESKSEKALLSHLNSVDFYLKKAIELSRYPTQRIGKLAHLNEGKDAYHATLVKIEAEGLNYNNNIKRLLESYKAKYPTKADKLEDLRIAADAKYKVILNSKLDFFAEKSKDIVDLSKLLKLYEDANKNFKILKDYNTSIPKKVKELDVSYSKSIKDMKARFYVQVGRSSWDSDSDWDSSNTYNYPLREVDEATFNYFKNLPLNTTIASETSFGTKAPTVFINKNMWSKLKINHKEKFPTWDDDSEYYVNELKIKYYHLYIIENDGKTSEKWEEVTPLVFNNNLENQGMSILTKPVGVFESEAIKDVAPMGMAYVGNPQYGKWETKSNGESFWSFYGKYMFISNMLGGHNYSRYEYDDYNRNYRNRNKTYYGSNGKHNYGTRGSVFTKSNAYKNSTFRKSYASNPKSSFSSGNLAKRKMNASRGSKSRSSIRNSGLKSSRGSSSSRSGGSRRGGGPSRGGK